MQLTNLYAAFDLHIDKHKVYKVEVNSPLPCASVAVLAKHAPTYCLSPALS